LNGLAHAHRAGLVHRDLKPDNVLLEERADGSVVPRIVDFGIAVCDASDDPIARRRLTEANTVIGTPTYMSPEQAMAKPLDARSDLFSLGVIMYELLAGMPPFSGEAMEVAYLSATTDAPSIAARAGIDVDPLLDAFARTLMARALDERFASADDALAMLDLIEHDRPAAMRALAARIPAEPVAHVRCSDEVGTQHDRDARISDEVATVRGRWTSQVTRVEHIVGARPARTRALMACGIAVATLVAIVGWSGARSHAVSSSVSAAASVDVPRIAPPVPAPTVAAVGTVSAPASSIATVESATSTASPRATIGTVPAAASNVARVGSAQAASDLHGAPSVAASLASSRRQAATHVEVPRGADQATPTAEIAVAAPAPASSVLAPSAQTVATASAPAASKLEPTAQNVVERYVAVGRKLRGSAGGQWSRYRLIRINDALATKASRTVALAALADIERSLAP
jgi:serine/threonine-protein kinase